MFLPEFFCCYNNLYTLQSPSKILQKKNSLSHNHSTSHFLIFQTMNMADRTAYPVFPARSNIKIRSVNENIRYVSYSMVLKVFSGYIMDKYNQKKTIAFIGYATDFLYKLALLFATSWMGILVAKVADRLGKGIHNPYHFSSVDVCFCKRTKSAGFDNTNANLPYFLYNLPASNLSISFGKLSDKIGRKQEAL